MSDDLKKPAGSIAIYKVGYNKRVIGGTYPSSKRLDAKTFFISMSKAIVYEYEQQGFCEFIDDAIDNRVSIDIIAYAAISNAKGYLSGGTYDDSDRYIPYVRLTDNRKGSFRPTWDDSNRISMNDYTYDYRAAHDTLLELRTLGRKAHLTWLERGKSEHQSKATAIVEDAKKKAEIIIKNANDEAERIANITQITELEGKIGEFEPDETIRLAEKYIEEGRQASKNELNIEVSNMLMSRDAQIGLMERLHDEMRDKTDSIHATWSEELTDTINNLSKMKEELYEHIHKWQISLYPYEIEPLAQRYIELYKIINVERIIDREVLFAYSKIKLQDERNAQSDDLSINSQYQKQTGGLEENTVLNIEEKTDEIVEQVKTTIDGLQRINRSLTIFLKKFEASLNGLGMYVYYPKENEQFDDIWHILENGQDGMGLVIKHCVVPGVAKKINDGEDDVIIPAIVEV